MRQKKPAFSLVAGLPLVLALAWLYPYIPGHDLSICAIKIGTGINCPGCGFIRSVASLMHGGLQRSIDYNPMGIVAVIIMSYLWIKAVILRLVLRSDKALMSAEAAGIVSIAFIAGLFLHWFFYLGTVIGRIYVG